ncbi:E3 ubiquitin- ligase Su(dx)-like isoform X1 [Brachionus plicatilis]|uniref:E3 ubiquitin-ligase Su(Dx)-like isoform X1 n=1 Tax=Brachionus plicatilis TaxID=10195 RepID=A0A3M7PP55_BRAPC|nr:E3 ubiquitin- ligase Su(dx)-like isoform X1 [Brachionus plicatilis]
MNEDNLDPAQPDRNSNISSRSIDSTSRKPVYQQIRVYIKNAKFTPSGRLFNSKADIYAEMIIDGNPSRKTEIAKRTWTPMWNEYFDIDNSYIENRISHLRPTFVQIRHSTGTMFDIY